MTQNVDASIEKDTAQGDEQVVEPVEEPVEEAQEAAAEAETDEPVEEQESELDALNAQLQEAQAQAAEYLDGWQRARAEFANYRRREEQRRQQIHQQIRGDIFKRLLPALDDMERAFQAVPESAQDDAWVEGLTMVGSKLQGALEKDGLSVMPAQAGDVFDPNVHEAVLCEPSTEYDEGLIIQVLQQGYKIDETVLRAALVRVSSGKIEPQTQDD